VRLLGEELAQAANGKHDYEVRGILGCQNLNCNGYKTDPNYADHNYNAQFIAPNQSAYKLGQQQLGAGQTYDQLVTGNLKKNPVGAALAGAGMIGLGVATGGGLPTLGLTGTGAVLGTGVNSAAQLIIGDPFDWTSAGMAGVTGAASSGVGFAPALLINTGGALAGSGMQGQNPNGAMAGAAVGTAVGFPIGAKIEGNLNSVLNPWYRQEWNDIGMGISTYVSKTPVPSWTGGVVGNSIQELTGNMTQTIGEKKK
jgi:filamentous hemagglutinin